MAVVGKILLFLLLIITALLFVPLTLHFKYLESFFVSFRFLFLKKDIYPLPQKEEKEEKPEKEKKKKKEEPKKEKEEKAKKKRDIKAILETCLSLLKNIWPPLRRFIKKIRICNFQSEILVATEDAAKTGILYGKMQIGMGTFLQLLDDIFTLNTKSINIYPDFKEKESKYYFEWDVKINIAQIICLALSILAKGGKDILKLIKQGGN